VLSSRHGDGGLWQNGQLYSREITREHTEMKSALLLNIVVRERPSILKLLASKNEALLIRRNAFLVLYFGLDIVDSVGRFDLESNRLTRQTISCLVVE
jgi:hypothetical protein